MKLTRLLIGMSIARNVSVEIGADRARWRKLPRGFAAPYE